MKKTDVQLRQEFLAENGHNPVWCLFEGVCPDCGSDVHIVSIWGTQEQVDNFTFKPEENVQVTVARQGYLTDCGIEWHCDKGHRHYAERSAVSGDWS